MAKLKSSIRRANAVSASRTVYGIVARDSTRFVPAKELAAIKTFAQIEQEERDAAEKDSSKKD